MKFTSAIPVLTVAGSAIAAPSKATATPSTFETVYTDHGEMLPYRHHTYAVTVTKSPRGLPYSDYPHHPHTTSTASIEDRDVEHGEKMTWMDAMLVRISSKYGHATLEDRDVEHKTRKGHHQIRTTIIPVNGKGVHKSELHEWVSVIDRRDEEPEAVTTPAAAVEDVVTVTTEEWKTVTVPQKRSIDTATATATATESVESEMPTEVPWFNPLFPMPYVPPTFPLPGFFRKKPSNTTSTAEVAATTIVEPDDISKEVWRYHTPPKVNFLERIIPQLSNTTTTVNATQPTSPPEPLNHARPTKSKSTLAHEIFDGINLTEIAHQLSARDHPGGEDEPCSDKWKHNAKLNWDGGEFEANYQIEKACGILDREERLKVVCNHDYGKKKNWMYRNGCPDKNEKKKKKQKEDEDSDDE